MWLSDLFEKWIFLKTRFFLNATFFGPLLDLTQCAKVGKYDPKLQSKNLKRRKVTKEPLKTKQNELRLNLILFKRCHFQSQLKDDDTFCTLTRSRLTNCNVRCEVAWVCDLKVPKRLRDRKCHNNSGSFEWGYQTACMHAWVCARAVPCCRLSICMLAKALNGGVPANPHHCKSAPL
jgi:hypothetical protein